MAGLWKNEKIDATPPRTRGRLPVPGRLEYVVVKESTSLKSDANLVEGSDIMFELRNSQHIIQLATNGRAVARPANIRPDDPIKLRQKRIIMEFLNGGDVRELLERQRRVGYHRYVIQMWTREEQLLT